MSASSSASENTPQKLHALGRMGRKVALIGSLLSASFAIDADAAITSNAPVLMDLHDNLPPKVSDGYIKPYKANHLRDVVGHGARTVTL